MFHKIWRVISNNKEHGLDYIDDAIDGLLSPMEKEVFNNLLRFRKIRICDIMIPRASIDAIENKSTIYEVLMMLEKYGRSWMPVYDGSLDNSIGIVHMRDLLAHISHQYSDVKSVNLSTMISETNLIKDVLFVPLSMLVSDLLCRIQESQLYIAIVIDEHGGTDGLVSYEDIVAFFIGHLKYERYSRKEIISAAADNAFIVDARADLEELAKVMGEEIYVFESVQDVDSLGGLIFSVLDRIPVRGEVIKEIPGFEIIILDSDVRCVRRVRIKKIMNSNS
ncbi:transporter associated domain-containing protein [Candidatus Liberibacter americanus]|uniref:Magnesium and cobalt efflux protein CorC n=1 Tax=Candidatus Liberibacter americanus str. Sao Paulo TaxID=1261131 RepID=U6B472_9HYPH|nr:transporter associated domain-containing protein [Candidatus Liberibacter americanus]AHA27438.1 Magnesium and cobalt efflux protein CorC [Candidatus Liberibacter americanus str. Sao Paulo]EMS36711.1 hemolysin protein [Candidatus Liberibacter americanus PW_SP]